MAIDFLTDTSTILQGIVAGGAIVAATVGYRRRWGRTPKISVDQPHDGAKVSRSGNIIFSGTAVRARPGRLWVFRVRYGPTVYVDGVQATLTKSTWKCLVQGSCGSLNEELTFSVVYAKGNALKELLDRPADASGSVTHPIPLPAGCVEIESRQITLAYA